MDDFQFNQIVNRLDRLIGAVEQQNEMLARFFEPTVTVKYAPLGTDTGNVASGPVNSIDLAGRERAEQFGREMSEKMFIHSRCKPHDDKEGPHHDEKCELYSPFWRSQPHPFDTRLGPE